MPEILQVLFQRQKDYFYFYANNPTSAPFLPPLPKVQLKPVHFSMKTRTKILNKKKCVLSVSPVVCSFFIHTLVKDNAVD